MNFDAYLASLQANLKRGSERTHYPAIQKLLEDGATNIIALLIEENCSNIFD